MTTWFTSDLHLNHKLVAFLRGFDSPEDHDAALEQQWRSQVGKRDKVWVLGDVHVGRLPQSIATMASLPGTKHLIAGNHDAVFPMHRGAERMQRKYLEAFESVGSAGRTGLLGRRVLMHHMPYDSDNPKYPDRFTQWRLRDEGHPLLHGHTHMTNRTSQSRLGTLQIHVGWDAWGGLVSDEQLLELLS